mmetsp:Transcript_26631/g.85362  ORF Transcript_26631/g.85362 Transcript_26631/m.85362 type:complete len:116 (+) Transcript_26631:1981-2328(+)
MLLWVAIGGQSPAGMPQMAENEDPLNFNPERWLTSEPGEAPEMTTKIPEAFMTFGAGKRICPGKALAEAEIGYMVYKLARDVVGRGASKSKTLDVELRECSAHPYESIDHCPMPP